MKRQDLVSQPPFTAYTNKIHTIDISQTPLTPPRLKTQDIWDLTMCHWINPLNAELNPICHLLALLGAHHIFHVSGLRVNGSHVSKAPNTNRNDGNH